MSDPAASLVPSQELQDELAFMRAGQAERDLVAHLTSALKVAQLHSLDNVVTKEALEVFSGTLASFLEWRDRGEVLLERRRVFVNGRMIRGRKAGRTFLDELVDYMLRMGMGGIIFSGAWSREAVVQLLTLFKEIGGQGTPESRSDALSRAARNIPPPAIVAVLSPQQAQAFVQEEEEGYGSERERAAYYFGRLLALAEASQQAVREGRSPEVHGRHLRQTLMKTIERMERSELFQVRLLGLTAMAPIDQAPLATHAANVCLLSMAMGRLLGLARAAVADLGFAALHHDLGRVGHKYEPAADGRSEDRYSGERHLLRGMTACLRGRIYGNAGLLRIIAGQEHHRDSDGYPESIALREPHPFSRVIAVADAFDRKQNGTPFREPISPKQALDEILADGERYHPAAAQLLRDILGSYPRGTVLRLWDGGVGVVVDGGARRGHKPIVRRLLGADQAPDEARTLLELTNPSEFSTEVSASELVVNWRMAVIE